ncbi:MAG TPA: phytanoyl-CoA dioxygenase family protein [Pyrinomonadaceae bacterium]|nr:phytanoyl-CoA dioxygenase family protein [Pyrinomonadaceae bacterium]
MSPKIVDRYERDGVVFPIPVLSAEEVEDYRTELDAICADRSKRVDRLHLQFPWAYQLVSHPAVLDAVEDVLGPNLLVDGNLVFYKHPRDPRYASWHQDSVYSGWHLTPSVSAWIALTQSEPANGCMRVIPGTHKEGLLEHENIRDPHLMNRRGERLRLDVDETQAVDVVLRPGEMSLHHTNIVHGSNPNQSDGPRIGFIVRFVTNLSRNRERPLMRVRGDADCSHLQLIEPPLSRSA